MERYHTSSRIWTIALIATALLHLGAAWGARALRLTHAEPRPPAVADPIQMVFRPQDKPKLFTEQPPDPIDEAPIEPDFLSNVDSRARDSTPAEIDDRLPATTGLAEIPQVRMEAGEAAEPAPEEPQPDETATPPEPQSLSLAALARELEKSPRERIPRPGSPGMSDLAQEAMEHTTSGAILPGDIRLSTTAWDFAPWLMAFRRGVMEHWRPPPAYHMGLIHGSVVMELEIARDGTVLRTDKILEEVGHGSLTSAAQLALRGAVPYRRLPHDFPDPTLILQIRFFYPNLKP